MAPLSCPAPRRHPRVISAVLGLATLLLLTGLAVAHSWYPLACCHDHDCMRVDTAERLADGSIRMRAGNIEVLVPRGFLQQPSQDNDIHMCVFRSRAGWQPRCVFMPAGV